MSFRYLIFTGACVAALSAGAGAAQQADGAIRLAQSSSDEEAQARRDAQRVVVSATRTEQAAENVPATVSVIDAVEIEDMIATDIKDLVRFEPGVSVRAAAPRFGAATAGTGRDGNSGFNIRGLEGNRVLIQIDGVRVPDAFEFGGQSVGRGDYLDLDLLKSAEILRGPASALYGSDGLAGAVSFITKDPDDLLRSGQRFGARGRIAYSSADDSWAESASIAAQDGAWQMMLTYTRRDSHETDTQGVNDALDSTRTTPNPIDAASNSVMGKLVFAPNAMHRFRLTGEYFDSEMEAEVYTGRTASTLDLDAFDNASRSRLALDYQFRNPGGAIERAGATVFFQDSENYQSTFEDRATLPDRWRINTFDNRVWGASGQLETGFETGDVQHSVLLGGDVSWTRQEGIREGTEPPAGETFPVRAFPTTDYTLAGLFVQDEISIADGRVLIYPALRFDAYDLSPKADPLYPGAVAAQDGSRLSPKLGAVAWATDHIGLFASYAAGFKAPSPTQVNQSFHNPIANYTSLPNPDLKPETSNSFEGGARLRNVRAGGADWTASATAFTAKYEDFIDRAQVGGSYTPADPAVFQFVNLSEVKISGFEARADARWANGLGVIGAFSYADGEQTVGGVAEPLQSVDPWKLVTALTWDDPRGRFGGQAIVTHSSGKSDNDVAQNRPGNAAADLFTADDFTILDLTAYWNINDALTLRAAVFNLFDEKYWWWGDVRGLSATSPVLDLYSQPGRNFSVSLVARF